MAGMERNPFTKQIETTPAAVGAKKYGPAASTTATSGPLPKDGFRARTRKKAQAKAIQDRINQLAGKPGAAPVKAGTPGVNPFTKRK